MIYMPEDLEWIKCAGGYLWHVDNVPESGKYNPGQKMFFLAVAALRAHHGGHGASHVVPRSLPMCADALDVHAARPGVCDHLCLLLRPPLPGDDRLPRLGPGHAHRLGHPGMGRRSSTPSGSRRWRITEPSSSTAKRRNPLPTDTDKTPPPGKGSPSGGPFPRGSGYGPLFFALQHATFSIAGETGQCLKEKRCRFHTDPRNLRGRPGRPYSHLLSCRGRPEGRRGGELHGPLQGDRRRL